MRIERRFTTEGRDAYDGIEFRTTTSEIRNPDGSVVFQLANVDVPADWSQVACDILAQKYFRKAGIPAALKAVEENTVPSWLWRKVADEDALKRVSRESRKVGETSARQVFDRLAGTWTYWGWHGGYFDSESDARAFFDEMRYMLCRQMAAPNSPQWFNTGLHWAYGIDGPAQGHYYVDFRTGELVASESAYEHPQPHACFIQGVRDDLVGDGGIMDLWVREARLFKYGSGTGSNFSKVRGDGEKLSGGGRSSGLMSFLKIGDRAAGAIKSGGTTRRAAKMVTVDLDHPDIEAYIDWKVTEEQKVAALVAGSKLASRHMNAVMLAATEGFSPTDPKRLDPKENKALKKAIVAARKDMIPENYVQRVIQFAGQGYTSIKFKTYDTDWDSEAYLTVSGQNSNNSVRISNDFIEAVLDDADWQLIRRTDGNVHKTLKARDLWEQIGEAAWACADPGVQFDTTINEWHTCPASGRINASNPCSEYMFLDDTACNLASLNLMTFRRPDGQFDIESFEHACRLWTVVLEISVLMAQFPSKEIAQLSYEFRTLGLGYANLGGLLMAAGLSYDSDEGRALVRRHHRRHDRRVLCHLRRDGAGAWDLPGLRDQPRRTCCGSSATIAAPPTARPRIRGPVGPAGRHQGRPVPRPGTGRGRPPRLGQRPGARRAVRLPQRAGHGDRPDRHHRPGHGLRHHRHRAGLRPGEVQEAGRRRLLQDHQPGRSASARQARLHAGADRRDGALRRRPRHAEDRPRRQPRGADGQGLHRRDSEDDRAEPRQRLRHQVRLQQVVAGRRVLHRSAGHSG